MHQTHLLFQRNYTGVQGVTFFYLKNAYTFIKKHHIRDLPFYLLAHDNITMLVLLSYRISI